MSSTPSRQLLSGILARIDREERLRALRWRIAGGMVALAVMSIAVVRIASLAASDLAASGFLAFLSTAIAEPGAALLYWRSVALTLLESLPAMSIGVLLLTIYLFLRCLAYLARFVRIMSTPARSAT